MTNLDIAHQRLHNQLITQPTFEKPGDVVQWLGAVQAQDYAAAKWAFGLRLQGATFLLPCNRAPAIYNYLAPGVIDVWIRSI